MNVRMTAWLSETEAQGVRELADEYGTSMNWVMRIAIRKLLGLPVRTGVTLVTRNGEEQ